MQQWMARIEALAERIAAAQTAMQAEEATPSQAPPEPSEASPGRLQSPGDADSPSKQGGRSPHMVHLQLGSPGVSPLSSC